MTLLEKIIYCYENITPFQTAILLSLIFLFILRLFLIDLEVPPGPKGLPLFGYWPFLKTSTCHIQLKKFSEKYGDIFSFRITGKLFIHLGSIKLIREAHLTKSECFEGRFEDHSLLTIVFKDGVAFVNGEPWKALRKFFLAKFKESGMNNVKENIAASVYDVLKDTVEQLHEKKGHPVKIAELATKNCMMVIRKIIFNDRGIAIEDLQELNEQYAIVSAAMSSTNFLLMGNFAKYFIFPFMPSYWSLQRSNKRIGEIFSKVVERHKSEYDENRDLDLIDFFIKERNDRRKKGDPTAAHFTDKACVSSLSMFVTDGVLTVGLSISVFLAKLVEYPEEQEKVYQEILSVVGPNRLPSIEDKAKLTYTNAFIQEVLRHSDFFPLFPSLECSKDTTVQGYKIPRGSITLINLYAAHRNPETFENPDVFDPSRYIPTTNKPKAEPPVIFGVGKRSCIGEAFSMIQIFLFITTIVQNFRLEFPDGKQQSSTMFWSTERIEVCAYPRSQTLKTKIS